MVSPASSPDIGAAEVRAAVHEHLGLRSAEHCERTAAEARRLAERHGLDGDVAELAGLLHDWSRDESDEALLDHAEGAGLAVLAEERFHPYLLHARVGADQVGRIFPRVPPAVLSAIAAHTVGAVPLAALDMVVYIADAIEPARDYPGVDELREVAATRPLLETFALAYTLSVDNVCEKGSPLHPMTSLVAGEVRRVSGSSLGHGEAYGA
jgi:predicted HD superfamily hydrolase involved in NAD metabolism